MSTPRDPDHLPGWYLLLFIGIPLGLAFWAGALSLAWMWLSNVGLIGGH